MPSTKKTCAYIKCDLGDNNERKEFYGTESAMYCCPKHGTYQRRLKAQYDIMQAKIKGEG